MSTDRTDALCFVGQMGPRFFSSRHRRGFWLGCGLGAMMACTAASGATRVFFDDFESGNVSKWTKNSQRDLCNVVRTSVDGVAPHGGAYMAECNWNGTAAWNAPDAFSTLYLPEWKYQSEFLIRFWIRAASDCAHSFGAKYWRLYPANPALDQASFEFQFYAAGGPTKNEWILNGVVPPVFWGTPANPLGDQAWHKMEIYVKENSAGASDGVIRVWQDGVKMQEMVNVVSVAPGSHWSSMYLMSNWSNNGPQWLHGANNHVEWDDVEIYSDVGNDAVGQLSDASAVVSGAGAPVAAKIAPPAAPSKVVVK